jgi:ubiquitin carboxyl-terminal hydrolase 7
LPPQLSLYVASMGRYGSSRTAKFAVYLASTEEVLVAEDEKAFGPASRDWGKADCVPHARLAELLDGKDTLDVVVRVTAVPEVMASNSKERTGMVGLQNQGATCYLNSLIETLFHTYALRRGLYEVDTSQDEAGRGVALELQRLFYALQTSDKAQSTLELTKVRGGGGGGGARCCSRRDAD